MNISRNFIVIGMIYVLIGMLLGAHMAASGNHAAGGAHAHINLIGFVMMVLFGLCYRVFPDLADSGLARLHFWLHQAGALVFLISLYLLLSGRVGEPTLVPFLLIGEVALILGTALFAWNALKNIS